MKKPLYIMLAGSASIICACGDSSSSATDNSGINSVPTSGTLVVNETERTLMSRTEIKSEACVNEHSDYTWKSVDFGADSSYIKYEFVGDTLVLFAIKDGYTSSSGVMFVGGSAGKLNGTWKSTACTYDSEKAKSSCYSPCPKANTSAASLSEEDGEDFGAPSELLEDAYNCLTQDELDELPEITLNVSYNVVRANVKHGVTHKVDFSDYTNSQYMSSFLRNLVNGEVNIPSTRDLFKNDSAAMTELIASLRKDGIELTGRTTNELALKFQNKTLSVSINNVSVNSENAKYALNLSSGKKNCTLTDDFGDVTKNECKAEYGEFFIKYTEESKDDAKLTIAYNYHRNNRKEFSTCAEDLIDPLLEKIHKSGNSYKNNKYSEYPDNCEDLFNYYYRCLLENRNCKEMEGLYRKKCNVLNKAVVASAKNKKEIFVQDARNFAYKLKFFTE